MSSPSAVSSPRPRKSGFTLIELLVVIAIIALLAAILFPVFSRVRENARRSSCMSNMKQLGLGMIQYAQDYDEYEAKSYYNGTGASDYSTGAYKWMDAIYPYIKSEAVYRCPSDKTSSTTPYRYYGNVTGPSFAWGSYVMNNGYYAGGGNPTHSPSNRRLSEFQAPSTTIWIVEQHVPGIGSNIEISWPDWTGTPGNGGTHVQMLQAGGNNYMKTDAAAMVERHLNTTNLLFCDGHVKAMALNTVMQEKPVQMASGIHQVMTYFTIEDD